MQNLEFSFYEILRELQKPATVGKVYNSVKYSAICLCHYLICFFLVDMDYFM